MATTDPLALINMRRTAQSEQADPRQVVNHAGGYVFQLDPMAQLRRFLVLGTTGGTYYIGEPELTKDNAAVVLELARTRGSEVVNEVLAISLAGRAPKQQPTLFTLAAVAGLGSQGARQFALAVLPKVARTGSHLFTFIKYVEQFRGWGPTLKRGVANWYLDKSVKDVAYQMVKYRGREDWTHRDVLRSAHPETGDPARRALFSWGVGNVTPEVMTSVHVCPELNIVEGFMLAQASPNPTATARYVREYRLSWEMLPTEHLTSPEVWAALLDNGMPQTALMRNLPRLTSLGLLGTPRGINTSYTAKVAQQLTTGMSRAKVHPINVLIALRTYAGGVSLRGSSSWIPATPIVDALDAGFYEAFGGVEPAGKRTLLALDVSGSMSYNPVAGLPLTPREASAAMAMVTLAIEPRITVVGFTGSGGFGGRGWRIDSGTTALTPLDLSPRRRLDDNIRAISDLPFGRTDCALPWTWAEKTGQEFDTIVTLTDSETWAGPIHPHQAMRSYRERTGLSTRSIVLGMTATDLSVNDPADPLGLDIAGMDSAVPTLISDFSAGRI